MQPSRSALALLAFGLSLGAFAASSFALPDDAGLAPAPGLGLRFVENAGQWPGATAYQARVGVADVGFQPDGITIRVPEVRPMSAPGVQIAGLAQPAQPTQPLPAAEVTFAFEAAADDARVVGHGELPGTHAFYLGSDAARWRSGVKAFGALEYAGLWPGVSIDVAERDGALHYDVTVEPGADAAAFALRVTGAGALHVDADGSLVAETERGAIHQTIPAAWDEADGGRLPVAARFVLRADGLVGIAAPAHDPSRRLVVDPGFDLLAILPLVPPLQAVQYYSIAVQPLTGVQVMAGFNGNDAEVVAWNLSGAGFLWSTIIGGFGTDQAIDLDFDAIGDVFVSGITDSLNLPTTPGVFQPVAPGGLGDAFVAHLTGGAGVLVALTYVGGTLGNDAGNTTIDIGADGLITLAGYTESIDFPVGPVAFVFDPTYNGLGDVWVMRMPPTLAGFTWSTYLGGAQLDFPGMGGVVVAGDGTVSVGGWTESVAFPLAAAFDGIYGGNTDGFLTRLTPTLGALVFSTYRGGPLFDAFNGIAVDDTGAVWGAGYTDSAAFPGIGPAGVLDVGYNLNGDAFLTKHSGAGGFLWGTYRGGSGQDSAMRVAVDRFGRAHISGTTNSGYPPNPIPFPFTPPANVGPTDPGPGGLGTYDGYVACIGPDGDMQSFSGYLGVGLGGDESLSGIALDAMGNAFACGVTSGGGPFSRAPLARCTFPWVDEGFALAGATEPQLMGDGTLTGGSPLELRISNLAPGAPCVLVYGFAPLFAPFRGGTMVPFPAFMVPGLGVPPGGEIVLGAVWPFGIPKGFLTFMQVWRPDPLGPVGMAATNGVMLNTP